MFFIARVRRWTNLRVRHGCRVSPEEPTSGPRRRPTCCLSLFLSFFLVLALPLSSLSLFRPGLLSSSTPLPSPFLPPSTSSFLCTRIPTELRTTHPLPGWSRTKSPPQHTLLPKSATGSPKDDTKQNVSSNRTHADDVQPFRSNTKAHRITTDPKTTKHQCYACTAPVHACNNSERPGSSRNEYTMAENAAAWPQQARQQTREYVSVPLSRSHHEHRKGWRGDPHSVITGWCVGDTTWVKGRCDEGRRF